MIDEPMACHTDPALQTEVKQTIVCENELYGSPKDVFEKEALLFVLEVCICNVLLILKVYLKIM